MSNKPYLLSDNLFENVALHPTYVVGQSGNDDVTRHETFRVADNLRDTTWWTTSGTNSARTIYVDCLTAVAPNTIILDRGHNLGGVTVVIKSFTDTGLGTATTIASCTIPGSAGGLPSDANGCVTPDGVWWKTFTGSSNRVQGLTIPAMGSGVAPVITGLYLGTGYRFPEYWNAPAAYDYGTQVKYLRNELSRGGLRSKSRPLNFDRLNISVDLDTGDYAGFDTEVRRLLRYGQPWWVCLDDSDTTGAGLMRMFQTASDVTYDPQVNPVHRQIRLDLEEVVPSLYV